MWAGALRNRVVIQSKTVTPNSFGEEVISWSTVATLWAAIEPLQGREYLEGAAAGAEVTTKITVRYYPNLKPEMRATWGSHTYDILSVIEFRENKREIQLMCKEVL